MLHRCWVRFAAACLAVVGGWSGLARGEDASRGEAVMVTVNVSDFGATPEGEAVKLYTLTNGKLTARVTTYGAILTELHVPDRNGKVEDVVLGFDSLKGYLAGHPYFGTTVGRVANRIAKAKFTLDGKEYTLAANNGPNTLHGGVKGWDKKVWKAEEVSTPDTPAVKFSLVSPDGDEGYPGTVSASVTYRLHPDSLELVYSATTDRATPINLTNHSYFNLSGPASGTILDHELTLAADSYTPSDDTLIPTGEIAPVKGTPLDFTTPKAIGSRIRDIKADPVGYDHNFVLRGGDGKPPLAARVHDPKSGRVMEVFTTEPGVQLYTSNFLDGTLKGKGDVVYRQHQAFCLETQHYPDSINQPKFPSVVLKPGETYTQTTVYKFSAK